MLRISVSSDRQTTQLDHSEGPIEFGRMPQPGVCRVVLDDPRVSRNQLRIRECEPGRVEMQNLSQGTPIYLSDGSNLPVGSIRVVELPLRLSVGSTMIEIVSGGAEGAGSQAEAWQTVMQPAQLTLQREPVSVSVSDSTFTPQTLAQWFETLISVQRSAAGSREFYDETAHAVVELVGLDRGLVLLRKVGPNGEDQWDVAASYATRDGERTQYSRNVLRRVVHERRTFFRTGEIATPTESTMAVEAMVVAPIFNPAGEVVGAVYGLRAKGRGNLGTGIKPLEAHLLQVLAAAVGAGLARVQREAEATRSRVQFEQFFSAELARELERDPGILAGRDCEVTVLFSDIRGFSRLSERLGPTETCRLMGDVMERLTARVMERQGVVIDYYGDGLLAMWNAPASQSDHALLACHAARDMLGELPALNATWQEATGTPLGLGIGINTGPARVGNMGSARRFKYGPMGHTVNLASRVEGATKHLRVPVLITGSTRQLLETSMSTRRLCRARLPGLTTPIDLYELCVEHPTPAWLAWRDGYEQGLGYFENGRWAKCCETIYPLLTGQQSGSYDAASLMLVGRAVDCLKDPPKDFDPVLQFEMK